MRAPDEYSLSNASPTPMSLLICEAGLSLTIAKGMRRPTRASTPSYSAYGHVSEAVPRPVSRASKAMSRLASSSSVWPRPKTMPSIGRVARRPTSRAWALDASESSSASSQHQVAPSHVIVRVIAKFRIWPAKPAARSLSSTALKELPETRVSPTTRTVS